MILICGRFTLISNKQSIQQRFNIQNEFDLNEPQYNIAPTEDVLAVIYNGTKKHAGYLKWGLVPSWSKDSKSSFNLINARSETAHKLPSFKSLMNKKRCLIVADSFYEWRKDSTDKRPERIQVENKGLFAFAGLFDTWRDGDEVVHSCTILTKESDSFMQPIHPRMPIILTPEQEDEWINHSLENEFQAYEFLQNIEKNKLTSYTVSNHVNYVKNKDDSCIDAITN